MAGHDKILQRYLPEAAVDNVLKLLYATNVQLNKVKPHGKEWKTEFKQLMQPFLIDAVYPEDLLIELKKYMLNPTATTSNIQLLQHLRKYDTKNDYLILADLPDNALFKIQNGFTFQKMEKMRKRYKCRRLDNHKIYLVSPLIEVFPVEKSA